jgi:hypothetical protein
MTISNDRPAYRILSVYGFYGPDDNLYQEGEEIYYDGEPNEEMEALNDIARAKMTAYLEKLDSLARQAAEKTGRPFVGRPRTLDGAIALASQDERNRMEIMGTKRDPNIVDRVEAEAIPEVGSTKRGRGRPLGSKGVKNTLSIAAA